MAGLDGLGVLLWIATTGCIAAMVGLAWLNLRRAPRLETFRQPLTQPLVSILIPARNEAANLKVTLPKLLASDYPHLEFILLDDDSTDDTAAVGQSFSTAELPIRLLSGQPLPPRWAGKNWACHQLAEAARGDILIFCDADVRIEPAAVSHTVASLQRYGAGGVCALAHQELQSWAEAAVVPFVVHLPNAGMLHLDANSRFPAPRYVTANGQWIAWQRRAYDAIGGHEAVSGAVVEDVSMAKACRQAGFRFVPLVATQAISVRMYRGFVDVWRGFGKNLFGIMQNKWVNAILVALFLSLAWILSWVGILVYTEWLWIVPLTLLVAFRLFAARLFSHRWTSIVMHPLGSLLSLAILIESIIRTYRQTIRWKDRQVPGQLQ